MGFNILDKDGTHIGWTASEFDNDSNLQFVDDTLEIAPDIDAIKANKVNAIKQQAAQLINDTEWQLQRATERDALGIAAIESETPSSVLSYREAIRCASNRIEDELKNIDDIDVINNITLEVKDEDYPNMKVLTHLQFLRRFTSEERVAINIAKDTNPTIADYMQMLNIAKFINIADEDVIAGVNALALAGVITKTRAKVILNGDNL